MLPLNIGFVLMWLLHVGACQDEAIIKRSQGMNLHLISCSFVEPPDEPAAPEPAVPDATGPQRPG